MSLYNEVRPTSLSEVIGQDKAVSQIKGILANGNVPNVCLFVGPRGTGKTSLARIFAKALNCHNPSESGPCGECESCIQESIDIIELDAASHNKVDDVHKIIDDSVFAPISKYKIYIIDEVHMLSTAAFNALLKLLEEPPAYCRFILCTTEEHKVPVTIVSRCRRFYFERIGLSLIVGKLSIICSKKNIPYTEDALYMIAKKSDGCMRDAESLIEVFIDAGSVDADKVAEMIGFTQEHITFGILKGIATGNSKLAFDALDDCIKHGKDLLVLVKNIIEALSDTVYFLQSNDLSQINSTDLYKEAVKEFSSITTVEKCLSVVDSFADVYTLCTKGSSPEFVIKAKILSDMHRCSEIASVEKRLVELEETCEALKNACYELAGTCVSDDAQSLENLHSDIQCDSSDITEESVNTSCDVPFSIAENNMDDEMSEGKELPSLDGFFGVPSLDCELPGEITLPDDTQILGTISLDDALLKVESCEDMLQDEGDNTAEPMDEQAKGEATNESNKIDDLGLSDMDDIPIMGILSGVLS